MEECIRFGSSAKEHDRQITKMQRTLKYDDYKHARPDGNLMPIDVEAVAASCIESQHQYPKAMGDEFNAGCADANATCAAGLLHHRAKIEDVRVHRLHSKSDRALPDTDRHRA